MTKILYVVNNVEFFLSHRKPIFQMALDKGFEVSVFCGKSASVEINHHYRDEIRSFGVLGIKKSIIPIVLDGRLITFVLGTLGIFFNLFKFRPDIIHSMSPIANIGCLVASFFYLKNCKIILSIYGFGSGFLDVEEGKGLKAKLMKLLLKLRSADERVSVFVQNRNDYVFFQRMAFRNVVQTFGSGIELGSPCDFSKKKNLVVFPGRVVRDKGIIEFCKAAVFCKKEFGQWDFIVAGAIDYQNPSALSSYELAELKGEGVVNLIGHVHEMDELFGRAKIVCLPSYREGFPKALMEASYHGCGIVATDVPGCRDVLDFGENGILVRPRDADCVSQALTKLMSDQRLLSDYAQKAARYARAHFSVLDVVREYERVYCDIDKSASA